MQCCSSVAYSKSLHSHAGYLFPLTHLDSFLIISTPFLHSAYPQSCLLVHLVTQSTLEAMKTKASKIWHQVVLKKFSCLKTKLFSSSIPFQEKKFYLGSVQAEFIFSSCGSYLKKKKLINYSQSPDSLALATREQCSTNDFFGLFWFNS